LHEYNSITVKKIVRIVVNFLSFNNFGSSECKSLPKQFLPAQDGLSFFGIALRRGISVLQKQGILLVVAGDSHRDHVLREFALLDADDRARCRLLPEHLARNTAPAAACAVSWIAGAYGSGRRAIILTSDHLISPLQTFGEDAAAAAELAAAGNLVVFGIPPTRAETGYGYIEQEAAIPSDTKGRCFTRRFFPGKARP
jgi:mannose-1-phosphate guanylyltransferase